MAICVNRLTVCRMLYLSSHWVTWLCHG